MTGVVASHDKERPPMGPIRGPAPKRKGPKRRKMEADPDTYCVALCAIRYAIGRMTYMPTLVCEWVKRHWHTFPKNDRVLIDIEVEKALEMNRRVPGWIGHQCDADSWRDFHAWVKGHLDET